MQFHLDGFRPGDPDVQPATDPRSNGALPTKIDVLIVGCGPAGLTLAAQLAQFPDISTCIIERKPGPLEVGQADGIAVRTVEMFNAFGFAERAMREAYWVNETVFWRPDPSDPHKIMRSKRIPDVEEGLSEFPHLILNQARVHDFCLDLMRNAPTRLEPTYGCAFLDLSVDHVDPSFPVVATVDHKGTTKELRARYVVGCDGARSHVRKSINLTLTGDSANQAWGVMDVLCVTDFPDIRLKAVIQSAQQGNVLIIPREGGYMVRFYIEMDKLADDERIASKNITADHLIAAAQRILQPYTLDVKEVAWWSVYEIGQRLTDRFHDAGGNVGDRAGDGAPPHVFIAGDACHTHSPKAGQGMNVSMRDAFNLGWKLAAVLRGQSPPNLLTTYSEERRAVAQTLIDFDREFAAMFSAPTKTEDSGSGVDPAEFQRYFVQHGRFTAGTAIQYEPSVITGTNAHQNLATGFEIGTRFHSAPVIRFADAKPMHLGHTVKADGRWRLFLFLAQEFGPSTPSADLCDWLTDDPASPIRTYTPRGADIDAVIDVRAVYPTPHQDLSADALPPLLIPKKGVYGLQDYEKVFCVDPENNIYEMRCIGRQGCTVIVRPDQHVAHVLPLTAKDAICQFFDGVLLPAT